MQVRCARCHALFALDDAIVAGVAAPKLQCGRCGAVFTTRGERPRIALAGVLLRPRVRLLLAGIAVLSVALLARAFVASGAREQVAAADALLMRNDLASLGAAAEAYGRAARGSATVVGKRAFALLLAAATHRDLAARLERRATALAEKLKTVRDAALMNEATALGSAREAHLHDAAKLLEDGVAAANAAFADDGENPWALRAMALQCALTNAPERARRYADAAARTPSPYDGLVKALSGDAPEAQLRAALAAEPRMIRARVELAALTRDRAMLDRVLADNPAHERARELAALLPPAP